MEDTVVWSLASVFAQIVRVFEYILIVMFLHTQRALQGMNFAAESAFAWPAKGLQDGVLVTRPLPQTSHNDVWTAYLESWDMSALRERTNKSFSSPVEFV